MRSWSSLTGHPRIRRHAIFSALILCITGFFATSSNVLAESSPHQGKGIFLIATEQLNGSSFQEAVILLTHHSHQGATGLTINRPTDIPLNEALPDIRQLAQHTDPLYLGGPVSTNAIFVLIRTDRPHESMHLIADNIYFATGRNAFSRPLDGKIRTYAGYAGWAAGQLQSEIDRGDWLIVHTDPKIIFEDEPSKLWQQLIRRWSGDWI